MAAYLSSGNVHKGISFLSLSVKSNTALVNPVILSLIEQSRDGNFLEVEKKEAGNYFSPLILN